MFSKELFAQRLAEVRRSQHETQGELGMVLGIKQNAVCEMERGRKTTTAEKIALICKHYRISSDYLLGLSDDINGGYERWTEDEEA